MHETAEPEAVREARSLNYDDRAAYWEREARNNAARADRCNANGEPKAAAIFDGYAASALMRARSERKHWIAFLVARAVASLHGPDPGLAAELSGMAEWLGENL